MNTICTVCEANCHLNLNGSLCAYCASRATLDVHARRSELVSRTREAYVLWGDAVAERMEIASMTGATQADKQYAARQTARAADNYTALEIELAAVTGLDRATILNKISAYPDCAILLRANL